uniref:Uncharacterized protein n=1 Tax=Avena sativa TaxID=4498 RepID=A0ACD5Z351_AVESA
MGEEEGDHRPTEALLQKLSESSYNSSQERLVQRTGTVWTAMAHIVTAVIGSGVLSLAWSVAQLGWVGGPAAIVLFAGVTVVQSSLLADCYISDDPDERGAVVRNKSYVQAVRLYLGEKSRLFCGFFISFSLFGSSVVYTLTSATSMSHRSRSSQLKQGCRASPQTTTLKPANRSNLVCPRNSRAVRTREQQQRFHQ